MPPVPLCRNSEVSMNHNTASGVSDPVGVFLSKEHMLGGAPSGQV